MVPLRLRLKDRADHLGREGLDAVRWALRLTAAAVAAYLVAEAVFPSTQPLLAPLTAMLVIQVTPVSLLASGVDRVVSVVAGVALAVGFSTVVPLSWWSLGLLIAVSILLGHALRLRDNLIEVAISAMLVLGTGSFGTERVAWERLTETLVGAGVGVAANLLFPPEPATGSAAQGIGELTERLAALLRHAADEVAASGLGADIATHADGWLEEARRINHQSIPAVGAALLRAEEGRKLNVRALRRPNAAPGLRQGLETLEHTAVTVRSLFRTVRDASQAPGWPEGDVGEVAAANLAQTFAELADGVAAFGELVRAEAISPELSAHDERHEVHDALEGLKEAQARLNELSMVEVGPVLTEVTFALSSAVKRILREMDLEERVRRQQRLQPQPRVVLTRPVGKLPRIRIDPDPERRTPTSSRPT